ncbi:MULTISPECIES: hypothetical protein [Brachyspira]|uniref:hypothetical protein n=1 Tax=Brachyspira TaxID=29521 RepID=UPI00036942B4|nr:hypothetical protein [Brachyspira innocens]
MKEFKEFEKQEITEDRLAVYTSKRIGKEIRDNAKKYNMKISDYLVQTHKFYLEYLKENKK